MYLFYIISESLVFLSLKTTWESCTAILKKVKIQEISYPLNSMNSPEDIVHIHTTKEGKA